RCIMGGLAATRAGPARALRWQPRWADAADLTAGRLEGLVACLLGKYPRRARLLRSARAPHPAGRAARTGAAWLAPSYPWDGRGGVMPTGIGSTRSIQPARAPSGLFLLTPQHSSVPLTRRQQSGGHFRAALLASLL